MHTYQFRLRRFVNWFSIGLAYAFLYMARYNLTVVKTALGDLMSKADFGDIFAVGAITYGLSFLINGPLTDRYGGRRMMLVATVGAAAANFLMGLILYGITTWGWQVAIRPSFMFIYAINMYFQSFGALAIVTVKAPWFHVSERGTFSTIFGAMISLGIYFAFDWGFAIVEATRSQLSADLTLVARVVVFLFGVGNAGVDQNWWCFFIPTILLLMIWVVMLLVLRNTPAEAGHENFATGEESVTREGERAPVWEVFRRLTTHPVLIVVCGIEFCSGIMRNGVMHWYPIFAKEMGFRDTFFITKNWGLMLLIAGVLGGIITGWASDRFFNSRRAPMSALCYALMLVAAVWLSFSLNGNLWHAGSMVLLISMAVIGVHGIMSGTATMDFGGAKNTGTAVGLVDGIVYAGTALQSLVIGRLVPEGTLSRNASAWASWPIFLIPFALMGLILATRIWNARPQQRAEPISAPLKEVA